MRIQAMVVALVVFSLLWNSAALAQERHVVAPVDMRNAMAAQAAIDQQNRDALLDAIGRQDVRDLAGKLGLSLMRAEGAIAALDSSDLANLAAPLRATDGDLAGGASHTVVISTTTLLLVLIIVILLLK